jgi:hypothetical protein
VELGNEAGLADAGLTDQPDRLPASVFDLPKNIAQDRELAVAIDKARRPRRYRFAQP